MGKELAALPKRPRTARCTSPYVVVKGVGQENGCLMKDKEVVIIKTRTRTELGPSLAQRMGDHR